MDFSTRESAAGDAHRCGQNKYAKDARAFHLERRAIRSVPRPRSATADHAVAETKTAEGNGFAAWERCELAETDTGLDFRVSAQ